MTQLRSTLLLTLIFLVSFPNSQNYLPADLLDAFCITCLFVLCIRLGALSPFFPKVIITSAASSFILFNIGAGVYKSIYDVYPSVDTLSLITDLPSLIEASNIELLLSAGVIIFALLIVCYLLTPKKTATPTMIETLALTALFLTGNISYYLKYGETISLDNPEVIAVDQQNFSYARESNPISYLLRSEGIPYLLDENKEYFITKQLNNFVEAFNNGGDLPEKFHTTSLITPDDERNYPYPTRHPFYSTPKRTNRSKAAQDKNIILIMMESVRESESGINPHLASATPFLDSLKQHKNSQHIEQFYSTAPLTVKSELSALCSVWDYKGGDSISSRGNLHTLCLPNILREIGYKTFWFHGNTAEFYDRHRLLPQIGIEHIYGEDEIKYEMPPNSYHEFGWGVSDPDVFDFALKKLEEEECCFFAEILTVSNHLPFNFDWQIDFPPHLENSPDKYYFNYRKGIYYTDTALKKFFTHFKQSKLHENTLLVITSDHGIWTFNPNTKPSAINQHEQFYRMPLVLYGHGLPKLNETLGSHLDIAPTLVDILQIQTEHAFLGNSLLKRTPNKKVYTLRDRTFGVRDHDVSCIPAQSCLDNGFVDAPCGKNAEEIKRYHHADTVCFSTKQNMFGSPLPIHSNLGDERNLIDYNYIGLETSFVPRDSQK